MPKRPRRPYTPPADSPAPRRGAARHHFGKPAHKPSQGPRPTAASDAAGSVQKPQPPLRHHFTAPPPPSPATKSRSHGSIPPELTDASRGERLQKVLALAGVASRRECEELIADGRVMVNGKFVTALPAWVDPHRDRIEVDGTPIRVSDKLTRGRGFTYLMLNKPRKVLSTADDPAGRRGVLDMVQLPDGLPGGAQRLFPVGRLDADSSGLILLTNDGQLANRLTHPRYGVAKQYIVAIRGKLTEEDIHRLEQGILLAHRDPSRLRREPSSSRDRRPGAAPVRLKRAAMEHVRVVGYQHDQEHGDRTNLLITLREGQNREIRRMLARLGFNVRRLRRVAIGPLKLKGLAVGQWRLLTAEEIHALRKATKEGSSHR